MRGDARHLRGTFIPQGAGITTLSVVLQAVAQRLENVFWNGSGWGIFWTDAVSAPLFSPEIPCAGDERD